MKSILIRLSVVLLPFCAAVATAADQPTAASGLRAELVTELTDVEKKLVDLAQAMPADKYGWRPGDGVRSVSEVYMHVAGANFFLPSFAGVKPPPGLDRGMEKTVTEKTQVIDTLKKSFDHAITAVRKTADADFDRKVKVFGGREATVRTVYLIVLDHAHEHLGQSIAYARINKVTPPWSEASPAPAAK